MIARPHLPPGTPIGDGVVVSQPIPPGHKVATRPIETGEPVRKYNQTIGFATAPIAPGEHVHVHNMGMGDFAKDYAYGVDAKPTDYFPEPPPSRASCGRMAASRRATTSASSPR